MPSVLAVSPHLDDVAFSCGGLLGVLGRAGWSVRVVTVFSGAVLRNAGFSNTSEPPPALSPFALACQLDKGLGEDVDYMALRRGEDAKAMRCLGAGEWRHLGLPEAPHRGYVSAPDLFAGVHADDDVAPRVREVLEAEVDPRAVDPPDLVLGPQGLGSHVDHLIVAKVLDELVLNDLLLRYRDTPYAARLGSSGQAPDEVSVDISATLPEKLAACAAYTSQLGYQFGGITPMRQALRAFAGAEAARCGEIGLAEVFAGPAAARECIRALA